MTDSTADIQKYLKTLEVDDPIQSKSKERVTRQMAEQIRKIIPLTRDRCNLCGAESPAVIPLTLKVCVNCSKRMIAKGGNVNVVFREFIDGRCELCTARTFTLFYVNPKVCKNCSRRIGQVHIKKRRELNEKKTWQK